MVRLTNALPATTGRRDLPGDSRMAPSVPPLGGAPDVEMRRHAALDHRLLLKAFAAGSAPLMSAPQVLTPRPIPIVVIGGGFAGASCARELQRHGGRLAITLIEPQPRFTAFPFSNAVIAGLRDPELQQFGYEGLARDGITVMRRRAVAIDAQARRVTLDDGSTLAYARLVLAPGIDLRFEALPGYDRAAAQVMPHAWKGGRQILALRSQLEAMEDGGLVVMSVPADPVRCPPGPYERASLIAHFLKTRKPRSKLIVLDAKDTFSNQHLFQAAWKALYPRHLEWVPLAAGGKVVEIDAVGSTLRTELGSHRGSVVNIIPPQLAGAIAHTAGIVDRSGWCPIDPVSFESSLQPAIHVIGDAAIAGAMPKSAFAAHAQANVCAGAVASLVRGLAPVDHRLTNTSYSLVAPDYGISVAGIYRPANGQLTEVTGRTSAAEAPPVSRRDEARHAEAWFQTLTRVVFG